MYSIIYFLIFTLSIVKVSHVNFIKQDNNYKVKFFEPVVKNLLKSGVDTSFVFSIIANSKTHFDEKYIKINVSGFLKKSEYQTVTWKALDKCHAFMRLNFETLTEAEIKYGVPKEVITSILWVETKLGSYLGSHHIPSVLLSTAMSNKPEFINLNIGILQNEFQGDSAELNQLEKKIYQRAKSKSEWALKELIALSKMSKSSPYSVQDLYGSWAGAFGMSQFLPSSYLRWGADGNNDSIINLFNTEDAIYSIGNYLKSNGWTDDPESQKKAVFHYNNSTAYVDGILKLAYKLKPKKVFEEN